MALSANTVWEVRTGGADDNGGGFVTGASGTDYSQQDTKRTATGTDDSTTDAVAVGTTTITSVSANFGTSIVGNIICLSGGTGSLTKGWYQVTARTNPSTITVDRTVATGTGITMNIGGALASLGMVGGAGFVAAQSVYIKSGTYTISSASTNISGGCFSFLGNAYIKGYGTSRTDFTGTPLLQASGISTFTILAVRDISASVINIRVDGAGLTSSTGMSIRGLCYGCQVDNCTNGGFTSSTSATYVDCLATGCTTAGAHFSSPASYFNCVARDGSVVGFQLDTTGAAVHCIADSLSGASTDGFTTLNASVRLFGCVAYNMGRHGFILNSADNASLVMNCIAEGNAGTGFNTSAATSVILVNNGVYNNGTDTSLGTNIGGINVNMITGSGSFFADAAGGDFKLNNTANAGALLRAAGQPGTLVGGDVGYLDIGALQHQDAGGGGSGGAVFVTRPGVHIRR